MRGQKLTEKQIGRVQRLLLQRGWNMQRVADAMNISYATVYRYTGGRKALLAAQQPKKRKRR